MNKAISGRLVFPTAAGTSGMHDTTSYEHYDLASSLSCGRYFSSTMRLSETKVT